MNASEVTVIVYQASGLATKKKGKQHKYNVTFGVNNNKARSENEDSPDGCPQWNTEATIKVDDPMDPLIMKVKDKDDILGQVTLHMHELPNSKPARPKRIPLQPHKKEKSPQGELVFVAWISAYVDPPADSTKNDKSSTLKKVKGAVSHSPLFNRKLSLGTSNDQGGNNLASQKAKLGGRDGSDESIDSTVSGFSTMSEATKKKRSALKKLKSAFKKSPALGGSKLPGKSASVSCMDLSMAQQQSQGKSNMLTVREHDLDGSQESLASQTSGFSNFSNLSKDKKSTKNPFKKLKQKMNSGGSGKLDKKGSRSMHDLAFGASPFVMQDISLDSSNTRGSLESLDKLKTSAMDKNFPNKFDLTAPKTLLSMTPSELETSQKSSENQSEKLTPILGHRRTGSDTMSINSTGSTGKMDTPPPQQRRRMSYQTRSLRDDPRERPKPENSPRRFDISSGNSPRISPRHVKSPSLDISDSEGRPAGRSLCLPSDDYSSSVRSPGIGSSKEDVRGSRRSSNKSAGSYEGSPSFGGKSYDEFESSNTSTPVNYSNNTTVSSTRTTTADASHDSVFHNNASTPHPNLSSSPEVQVKGLTTKHIIHDGTDLKPEITGISPSEGSIEGGTKITIRGSYLGVDKSDIVWLSICGSNCLSTLQYFSEYKLQVTTKAWKAGSGKIVMETQSGGRSNSLGEFTYVDYNPEVEEGTESAASSRFYVDQDITQNNPAENHRKKSSDVPTQPVPPHPAKPTKVKSKAPEKPQRTLEVTVKELKREDPEGMPMGRDSSDKNSLNKTTEQQATSPETTPPTHRKLIKEQEHDSMCSSVAGEQSREELLAAVKALREENKVLEADNKQMKGYIDRIIDRVIDRCPDVLCIDMTSSNVKK